MLKPGKRPRAISAAHRVREGVELVARLPGTAQKIAVRARVVLAAVDGESNADIARALAIHENTVWKWRRRWEQATDELKALLSRLEPDGKPCPLRKLADALAEEILDDAPRSGAPPRAHGGADL